MSDQIKNTIEEEVMDTVVTETYDAFLQLQVLQEPE